MKLPKQSALEVFKLIVKLEHPELRAMVMYIVRHDKSSRQHIVKKDYALNKINRAKKMLIFDGYLRSGSSHLSKGFKFTEKGEALETYLRETGELNG